MLAEGYALRTEISDASSSVDRLWELAFTGRDYRICSRMRSRMRSDDLAGAGIQLVELEQELRRWTEYVEEFARVDSPFSVRLEAALDLGGMEAVVGGLKFRATELKEKLEFFGCVPNSQSN